MGQGASLGLWEEQGPPKPANLGMQVATACSELTSLWLRGGGGVSTVHPWFYQVLCTQNPQMLSHRPWEDAGGGAGAGESDLQPLVTTFSSTDQDTAGLLHVCFC